MSNIYKTNFEKVKETYKDIFEALERAFKKFDMDYYLIGAQSRDVWTDHLDLIKRMTRDIDYCVYVRDRDFWNELNEYLINEEGFTRDKQEPYRFYKDNIVDLIPFGGMEINGEVRLDNPTTELSVYGCKEVTEDAAILDGTFKVVTLAGLCIMKLIAYYEKPDRRAKDLDDYFFIVKNYHEIAGEELFERKNEDLIEGDFEMNVASARLLGRNMALTLNKNEKLKEKIISILSQQLRDFNELEIEEMYKVREKDDKVVLHFKLVSETIKGIKD
jgi:predicted nucleotidyltransferase